MIDVMTPRLALTLSTSGLITAFQAGRVAFYAYKKKSAPLHYKPEAIRLFSEMPHDVDVQTFTYSLHELFAGYGGIGLSVMVKLFDVPTPFNILDGALRTPFKITQFLGGPLINTLSRKQEALCLLSAIAIHWTLWKIMKHSAEWYVHKYAKFPIQSGKQEELPIMSSNDLQQEALFTSLMEEKLRAYYGKLDAKEYEQCAICWEQIPPKDLHITRCEQPKAYAVHYYHTQCINDWKSKIRSDCPTCRGTMLSFRVPPSVIAALSKPQTAASQSFGWIRKLFSYGN